jgi:hypothetical protein
MKTKISTAKILEILDCVTTARGDPGECFVFFINAFLDFKTQMIPSIVISQTKKCPKQFYETILIEGLT